MTTPTNVPLSVGRRHIADLSWLSLRVPRCILRAELDLSRAQAARAVLASRPAWPMILAKAFALVAAERPSLRRIHATLPTPRLLELPRAIGCIMVERQREDGPMVMAARFPDLATTPLPALCAALDHAKTAPEAAYRPAYRLARMVRLPWLLRRAILRWSLATARPLLRHAGTFAVSSVGQHGAAIVDSVSPLPVFLTFGPIGATGRVEVFMAFDHRVMDGAEGAAALGALQAVLDGAMTDELEALSRAG